MSAPMTHIRCRKAGCGQLLAKRVERGYRVYAEVMIGNGGRVSLSCPDCGTARSLDRSDALQAPVSIAPHGEADAA